MFFEDQFTDTNGTQLESHTSDSSHTWSKHSAYSGDQQIDSNALHADGPGVTAGSRSWFVSNVTPPSANYSVEAEFVVSSLVNGYHIGFFARSHTTVEDGIRLIHYGDSGGELSLTDVDGGTLNGLGTYVTGTGTFVIRMEVDGTSVSVYVDDVLRIGPVTTNITATGTVGTWGRRNETGATSMSYLTATEITSGVATKTLAALGVG